MKKAFKLFAMMLLAGAVMFTTACTKDDDNSSTNSSQNGGNGGNGGGGDNPQPQPQPQQSGYTATFNGEALDVAGYSDMKCGEVESGFLWFAEFAKSSEGQSVYFPYIVMYMLGSTTADFNLPADFAYPIELYKDTYFTDANEYQYGDWQYYATNSMNCTAMDMTNHSVSFTGSFKMYSLADIVEEVAENPEGCAKADLVITASNLVFELQQGKAGFHKMNVVK